MITPAFPMPFLPLLMIQQQELTPRCSLSASDNRTLSVSVKTTCRKTQSQLEKYKRKVLGAQMKSHLGFSESKTKSSVSL